MLEPRKKLVIELFSELVEGFQSEVDLLEKKNQRLKDWDQQVKKLVYQLVLKIAPDKVVDPDRGHTVDALLTLGHEIDRLLDKGSK